ncbi:hypothetical protein ACJIZ3_018828 [Penstemon smallii]|uniref:Splicing factor Cactin n=1 Tax=Penstemon smallii TaxID=265156 RepID=A0ABD3T041_9LAMI
MTRKISEKDIAEYLVKKAHKKATKVAKKLKSSQTVFVGYSNDSNPFGDSNLNEKFVWRKKIELDVSQGVPLDEFSLKAEKKRWRDRMIEKVKKRRVERAMERAQHEEEMALLATERARAEFQEWEKKEEELLLLCFAKSNYSLISIFVVDSQFHFDQSKIRSEIRLREGLIKPIDILTKHLDPSNDFGIEMNEPYMVFKGLTSKEMKELHDDIKMHLDLDRATPTHIRYWEALLVVCEWELAEARKKNTLEMIAEERGLHASIEEDVKNILQGKSYVELEALQSQIESQMQSGTAKVVEYWEALLKRLHIYKAKACLKDIHAKMLQKYLKRLEALLEDAEVLSPISVMDAEVRHEEQEEGSYSPKLLHGDEYENEEYAIDPEEDKAILERRRSVVKEASGPTPPAESNNEISVDCQVNWWHGKYRPRKPKYFNRVHTGYTWNKYNQTHYDHDNPPPKFVQGYKFNIFYPDLIDKSKAPTYTITKDGDSAETCIITFHAGPPYEDIAFRIVNNEWDKRGLKCTFERGILRVYFNFQRYQYRR